MVELIEVVLESMIILVSPEKTAEKVRDENTSRLTRIMLITLFTLLYGTVLIGILISVFLIPDGLYKVFATLITMFLAYCLLVFYRKIYK